MSKSKNEKEKNHEAVITYEYYQTEKVKWYAEIEQWEGLKSIGLVKRTIEKETVEIFKILCNFNTSAISKSR